MRQAAETAKKRRLIEKGFALSYFDGKRCAAWASDAFRCPTTGAALRFLSQLVHSLHA
jgi:hypothetical protein